MINKKVVLAKRPEGQPQVTDFTVVEEELPELGADQVLLAAEHLSIDAFIRTTLDGDPGLHGTMDLNTPVVALGVGRVVQSQFDGLNQGDAVFGPRVVGRANRRPPAGEPRSVARREVREALSISRPHVLLGMKDTPGRGPAGRVRRRVHGAPREISIASNARVPSIERARPREDEARCVGDSAHERIGNPREVRPPRRAPARERCVPGRVRGLRRRLRSPG